VRFQGGAIPGVDLGRWVKSGDVFALVRVGEGPGARGERVEFALLRAREAPRNGECECELFHRFKDPTLGWPTTGYRAIKLGTARAPVRLRLVDENNLPMTDVSVFVSPSGFDPKDARDSGTARDGLFETTRPYERIAFVRVASGETNLAQMPLPILDDRIVTCKVPAAAGGVALVQFEIDARNCLGRFRDLHSRLDEQDKQIGQLIADRKNEDALKRVKASLEQLGPELLRLGEELAKLKTAARELPTDAGQGLQACEVYDREIHKREKGLRKLVGDLEGAIARGESKEARDEKEQYRNLVLRAEQEEERAEYEKAIATYEEVLEKAGEWKVVHDRLDKLKKEWEPKGEKHQQARDFIFKTFDAVKSIDELETQLPKAREAFQTCKAVGDKLGPRRLLLKLLSVSDLVTKEVGQLSQSTNEEDKPRLEQVKKLGESLKSLLQEVADYFEAKKPAG
jgi:tetratricopeptide (TPR) repeat protein